MDSVKDIILSNNIILSKMKNQLETEPYNETLKEYLLETITN